MNKIMYKKFYIATIVLAFFYTFIFSRVLFPTAPENYRICYIDNKVVHTDQKKCMSTQ